jgi:serine protease Do
MRSSCPRVAIALLAALAIVAPVSLAPLAPARAYAPPQSFADLAQQLLPAVVNISTTTTQRGPAEPDMPNFPPGSPFEQFFKDFMDKQRRNGGGGAVPQAEHKMQFLGSGFIIDPSGIVVTNNHVIESADQITVTLQDNTALTATLIGRDERADLAVLQVKPAAPLPSVPFGNSDTARVGDWVLAIGNPFGLGGSVTAGIVSARNRDIHQGPYDEFLQTDAAINHGNSGGPLFNMAGEVIGINTAIYSPSGGSIGIGFSIPSNAARKVVADLREFGHVRRGWLGVGIQQVTPDIAESLGLHDPKGALISRVFDDGPAAKAAMRQGDVVLKFNGAEIKEVNALQRIVAATRVGDTVPLVLWRGNSEVTLQVTVGELPEQPKLVNASANGGGESAPANKPVDIAGLGLQLAPITQALRDKYSLSADQTGVVVASVSGGGVAAGQGVKAGDVIVEVQQEPVASPADVASKVDGLRKQKRKTALMLIQNSEGLRWVPMTLDKAPG